MGLRGHGRQLEEIKLTLHRRKILRIPCRCIHRSSNECEAPEPCEQGSRSRGPQRGVFRAQTEMTQGFTPAFICPASLARVRARTGEDQPKKNALKRKEEGELNYRLREWEFVEVVFRGTEHGRGCEADPFSHSSSPTKCTRQLKLQELWK